MAEEVYTLEDLRNWPQRTAAEQVPLRLAVLGDPVAHSRSPQMHNAALAKLNLPARYTRLHLREGDLAEALTLLPKAGFLGVNVTIPHKTAVLPLLHRVDDHAARIGAVNTIVVQGEELVGFNTDGPGLVRAVRAEFGQDLRDLRVLIVGAGGGAGRAIAVQCALERCERLVLVNRTPAKLASLAVELAGAFSGPRVYGPAARLSVVPWEEEALRPELDQVDLIINCSTLGMKSTDPAPLASTLLQPHHLVFDTTYVAERSKLLQAAREAGARGANGLSMLLHQGVLAFEIWFNQAAPVETMRTALLKA